MSSSAVFQRLLLDLRAGIQGVPVSLSRGATPLLQVIMKKSSSFPRGLHRTYERIRGYSGRTGRYSVAYLVDNIREGGGK